MLILPTIILLRRLSSFVAFLFCRLSSSVAFLLRRFPPPSLSSSVGFGDHANSVMVHVKDGSGEYESTAPMDSRRAPDAAEKVNDEEPTEAPKPEVAMNKEEDVSNSEENDDEEEDVSKSNGYDEEEENDDEEGEVSNSNESDEEEEKEEEEEAEKEKYVEEEEEENVEEDEEENVAARKISQIYELIFENDGMRLRSNTCKVEMVVLKQLIQLVQLNYILWSWYNCG